MAKRGVHPAPGRVVRLMALLVSRVRSRRQYGATTNRVMNLGHQPLWRHGVKCGDRRKGFSRRQVPVKNPFVRRFFIRTILFLVLVLAGYVLWPRFPSLEAFRPHAIAALECEAFENTQARRPAALVLNLYRIFQEEFRLAPIAAAEASWNASRAVRLFHDSADNADRERALPYLERTFEILRRETKASFAPQVVARLQLERWMLAADSGRQAERSSAIAEILAMLYGGSASDYPAAAASFAKADRLLASKNPNDARLAAASAWRRLAERLKARTQAKS